MHICPVEIAAVLAAIPIASRLTALLLAAVRKLRAILPSARISYTAVSLASLFGLWKPKGGGKLLFTVLYVAVSALGAAAKVAALANAVK